MIAELLILSMTNPLDKNHRIYFVPGLHRGLEVLEIMRSTNMPMSITELTEILGLSRSSVFRLVYTLRFTGFLQSTDDRKLFVLGPRAFGKAPPKRTASSTARKAFGDQTGPG